MNSAELLQELRNETLPLVPGARKALERARSSQDPKDVAPVRELLHKVAGTAAPLGLPQLSQLARFGEELAVLVLSGDARPSDGTLTLLGRMLDAVDVGLAATGAPPPPSLIEAPVRNPPPTPATSRAAAPPLPVPELEKPQVLFVDGDVVSQKLFSRFLKDAGFELRPSPAQDALAVLEGGFGDVLLLDVSGARSAPAQELVAQARARHVPIVAISKTPASDGSVASIASEVDEFLTKPVKPEELVAKVRAQSERRRAIRSARQRAPTGRLESPRPPPPRPSAVAAPVLVVDDSRVIRGLVKEFLSESHLEVVEAEDGNDALTVLARLSAPPGAVIVDMQMPELDGIGLTRALRADPRYVTLPVVLLSAQDDEASKRQALDAGANAYLVKSRFDAQELRKALRGAGFAVAEPLA